MSKYSSYLFKCFMITLICILCVSNVSNSPIVNSDRPVVPRPRLVVRGTVGMLSVGATYRLADVFFLGKHPELHDPDEKSHTDCLPTMKPSAKMRTFMRKGVANCVKISLRKTMAFGRELPCEDIRAEIMSHMGAPITLRQTTNHPSVHLSQIDSGDQPGKDQNLEKEAEDIDAAKSGWGSKRRKRSPHNNEREADPEAEPNTTTADDSSTDALTTEVDDDVKVETTLEDIEKNTGKRGRELNAGLKISEVEFNENDIEEENDDEVNIEFPESQHGIVFDESEDNMDEMKFIAEMLSEAFGKEQRNPTAMILPVFGSKAMFVLENQLSDSQEDTSYDYYGDSHEDDNQNDYLEDKNDETMNEHHHDHGNEAHDHDNDHQHEDHAWQLPTSTKEPVANFMTHMMLKKLGQYMQECVVQEFDLMDEGGRFQPKLFKNMIRDAFEDKEDGDLKALEIMVDECEKVTKGVHESLRPLSFSNDCFEPMVADFCLLRDHWILDDHHYDSDIHTFSNSNYHANTIPSPTMISNIDDDDKSVKTKICKKKSKIDLVKRDSGNTTGNTSVENSIEDVENSDKEGFDEYNEGHSSDEFKEYVDHITGEVVRKYLPKSERKNNGEKMDNENSTETTTLDDRGEFYEYVEGEDEDDFKEYVDHTTGEKVKRFLPGSGKKRTNDRRKIYFPDEIPSTEEQDFEQGILGSNDAALEVSSIEENDDQSMESTDSQLDKPSTEDATSTADDVTDDVTDDAADDPFDNEDSFEISGFGLG